MKGMIIDVYPEGRDSFRGCVLEVIGGMDELAKVINLETGEIVECMHYECGTTPAVINNIFEF